MRGSIGLGKLSLVLLVEGCTPKIVPAPLPTPTAVAPASQLRATPPTPSSEETDWAKVIEEAKK